MRLGPPERPHLVQHDRHAGGGKLPSGLAAGKSAADDMATPPDCGGVSLENATAIAPRFIRSLPVLRCCVGSRTRRAVG